MLRANRVQKKAQKPKNTKKVAKKQQKKQKKMPASVQQKRNYNPIGQSPDYGTSIHSPSAAPDSHGISGHKQRVMLLYRKMLRNTFDWTGEEVHSFNAAAQDLHQRVAATKHLTDPNIIETLIKDAEIFVEMHAHPNPYRPLMHPNGGLWGRNYPMPRETLKPLPPDYEIGRNYQMEEMIVRHIHASPSDPDYAPTQEAYAKLKVARGEHVEPEWGPAELVINPVVQKYCLENQIMFTPTNPDEMSQVYAKMGIPTVEEHIQNDSPHVRPASPHGLF